jgi:hypothetical protein
MKSLVGLVSAMVATGCCTSMTRAEEIQAELREDNVVRAEPAMRRAASERGATLLPERALEFGLIPRCEGIFASDLERICVLTSDHTIHRIRGVRGAVHMAISIEGHAPTTTRLARRGDTFLFLVPRVTARKVSTRTQCECDRSPKIVSMSGFLNLGFAFMLEDVPSAKVVAERIAVPVVEDFIEWECKMGLL